MLQWQQKTDSSLFFGVYLATFVTNCLTVLELDIDEVGEHREWLATTKEDNSIDDFFFSLPKSALSVLN